MGFAAPVSLGSVLDCSQSDFGNMVMSDLFQEILKETRQLDSKERALLAHELIMSLEGEADEGAEDAWAVVVEERRQALESGKVKAVSWAEIRSKLT
jgi:hypothetical protein